MVVLFLEREVAVLVLIPLEVLVVLVVAEREAQTYMVRMAPQTQVAAEVLLVNPEVMVVLV